MISTFQFNVWYVKMNQAKYVKCHSVQKLLLRKRDTHARPRWATKVVDEESCSFETEFKAGQERQQQQQTI